MLVISNSSFAQVKVYERYEEFEKEYLTKIDRDSIYVINFWATWCVPCVKELPYFEALHKSNEQNKVNVLLVSLDFEEHLTTRVRPFIEKKEMESEVIMLTDGNSNNWINKVDPSWSGALPATIIYSKGIKYFFEKSYHSLQELENEINKLNQL